MKEAIWILLSVQYVVVSIIFLSLPSFRRGLLFGVTVPVDFSQTAEGQAILRRFRILLLTAMVAAYGIGMAGVRSGHSDMSVWAMLASIGAGIGIWSYAHRQTVPFRVQVPVVRTAPLGPTTISFPWAQVLSILPLAVTAIVLRVFWSQLPARFPRRWDDQGVATWSQRTIGGVYAPILTAALLYVFMLALLYMAPRIRNTNAYLRAVLAFVSWLLMIVLSCVALIPLAGAFHVTNQHAGALVVVIVCLGALAVCGVVAVTALHSRRAMSPYGDTGDAGWKAGGILYYNPGDPALWVEKRMGVGWTLNFARPQSWLFLGLLLTGVIATAAAASFR